MHNSYWLHFNVQQQKKKKSTGEKNFCYKSEVATGQKQCELVNS